MRTDVYGQMIFDENDLCEFVMCNNARTKLKKVLTDSDITFSAELELENTPEIISYKDPGVDISEFDKNNQNNWYMPIEYKNLDIAKYVLEQCQNDSELQRAGQELLLFQERDMFDLLRYLKYLVDTMRKNNIVWGVGRGSSVSSFVLYLLGIHKINSLYFDLSVDEFLK